MFSFDKSAQVRFSSFATTNKSLLLRSHFHLFVSSLCPRVAFKVERARAALQKINPVALKEGHYANQAG